MREAIILSGYVAAAVGMSTLAVIAGIRTKAGREKWSAFVFLSICATSAVAALLVRYLADTSAATLVSALITWANLAAISIWYTKRRRAAQA